MLIEVTTTKPLEAVDAGLHEAAARHKFGILGVHNLQDAMKNKGVEFAHPVMVYEVCNPFKAKAVLEANPTVSTALPCRISVYRKGGETVLATLQPTVLLPMFGNPELQPVAQEVEDTLTAMMKEAAAEQTQATKA